MRKVAYRANGVPFKILSRILWHPAFLSGYPVRFRVATNVTKPTVRFNGYWLDIRLPPDYGRHIRLLARLVKQLRNGRNGKRKLNRKNEAVPKRPSGKICHSERLGSDSAGSKTKS